LGKSIWLDAGFREELAVCAEYRIPHSTLCGSPEPGLWTDADRAKAIAYRRETARVCPSCGTKDDDWIDPDTHRPYDPPQWEPTVHTCFGCGEVARLRRALPKDASENGTTVRVAPYDPERETPGLRDRGDGPDPDDHV
jgi:hypothetical protein